MDGTEMTTDVQPDTVSADGSDLDALDQVAGEGEDVDLPDDGEEDPDAEPLEGAEDAHEVELADGTKKRMTTAQMVKAFKDGVMMQSDYTKKTTELKSKVREAERALERAQGRESQVMSWVGALKKATPDKAFTMLHKIGVPIRDIVEGKVNELVEMARLSPEERARRLHEQETNEVRQERENIEREKRDFESRKRAAVWAEKLKVWVPEALTSAGIVDTPETRNRIAQAASRLRRQSGGLITQELLQKAAQAIKPQWEAEFTGALSKVESLDDLKARIGDERFNKLMAQAKGAQKQRPKLPPVTQAGARKPTAQPQSNNGKTLAAEDVFAEIRRKYGA